MARRTINDNSVGTGCAAISFPFICLWCWGILGATMGFLATCWILPVGIIFIDKIKNPLIQQRSLIALYVVAVFVYLIGICFIRYPYGWPILSISTNLALLPLVTIAFWGVDSSFNKCSKVLTLPIAYCIILIVECLLRLFGEFSIYRVISIITDIPTVTYENLYEEYDTPSAIRNHLNLIFYVSMGILIMIPSFVLFLTVKKYEQYKNYVLNKKMAYVLTATFIVYCGLNTYQHFVYYIPEYYTEENSGISLSEASKVASTTIIEKENKDTEAFSGIYFYSNRREVDLGLKRYISSLTQDSITYLFNKNICITSTSCSFGAEGLESITLNLNNVIGNKNTLFVKRSRCISNIFSEHLSEYYDVTELYERKEAKWEDAISTLTSKYGKPIIELSDSFNIYDRVYFWKFDNKVIRYHINSPYSSYLTYIVNSHILRVIREAQIEEKKQKEDSILTLQKEQKEKLDKRRTDSLANIQMLEKEQKENKRIKETTSNSI